MNPYIYIKSIFYTISGWFSAILLYFLPIKDLVHALAIMFAINFVLGILAGILVQGEKVDFKKALLAFAEIALYLVILTCVFNLGEKMKGSDWIFAMLIWLTWAWHYFYVSNILKNMTRLLPNSKGLRFAYYILGLEFIKRIPGLRGFERKEKLSKSPCK